MLVVSDTARRSFKALLAIDIGGVQLPPNPLTVAEFLPCLDMLAAKLLQTRPRLAWSVGEPRQPQQRRRRKDTCCVEPAATDGSTGGAVYCATGFTRKIRLWLET